MQVFFAFLNPHIFADGIQVGSKFTCEYQLVQLDLFVNHNHGLLENIPGLIASTLVVYDISFDEGEVGIIDLVQNRRLVVSDSFDQAKVRRKFHGSAGHKKSR